MCETDSVRVLPNPSGFLVDPALPSVICENLPVDFLEKQYRSLAPHRGFRSVQVGLDLIVRVLDLTRFVVRVGEFASWNSTTRI